MRAWGDVSGRFWMDGWMRVHDAVVGPSGGNCLVCVVLVCKRVEVGL